LVVEAVEAVEGKPMLVVVEAGQVAY